MHDPMTVAWEVKYPWLKHPKGTPMWPDGYRETFATIWHVDPETDGTDDSCGWFARARHGDLAVLERIKKAFAFDWDRTWESEVSGRTYFSGFFAPTGEPTMSPMAITLNLYFLALREVYGGTGAAWKPARRWMQRHLFDILFFAENKVDSLLHEIVDEYGGHHSREDRIDYFANVIYGDIVRKTRPWYREPRWHILHWKVQIHPWEKLRRWLFDRCATCGKRFGWNESPVADGWADNAKMRHMNGCDRANQAIVPIKTDDPNVVRWAEQQDPTSWSAE